MNEMIERVAMAIEIEVDKLFDINNICGFYDKMAKAAIAAMREPTDEMLNTDFTNDFIIGGTPEEQARIRKAVIFRSMIDTALKE